MESQLKAADSDENGGLRGKILAIFPGALGDFICFLPALEKLGRRGEVDLLARSEYAELVSPAVSVRSLERQEIARLFVPEADRDAGLRRFFSSYAAVYSWMGTGQRDFVANLERLCAGRLGLFSFLPRGPRIHATDYYLSCLGPTDGGGIVPMVRLKSEALGWGRRYWKKNRLEGRPVLALAPGSGAVEKNWPVQFYRALARWWEEKTLGRALVILGIAEEEIQEMRAPWDHGIVARGLALERLASLLALCDLYVGNDSGLSHLAAALEVRTVALFGPSDTVRWAPRGKRATVITKGVECSPCGAATMKICPHRNCLTGLSPEEVMAALAPGIDGSAAVDGGGRTPA